MPGHDEVRAVAEDQLRGIDPAGLERIDLAQQDLGVHSHTVADNAGLIGVEDACGHNVEFELSAFVDNGVAGVVASRIAGDNTCFASEEIDDSAFAFVAPLPADNDDDRHG